MTDAGSYWERPEQVDDFAGRAADRRLVELLPSYSRPGDVRVLDLGCAGGRNTVLLAERGFDVYALDASMPMVQKTRERVADVVGSEEAARRVRSGRMEELGAYASEWFHLVLALGILHSATSHDMWDRALAEAARVLVAGGLLLVSIFSPRSDPKGLGLRPIAREPHVYEGFDSGPMFMFEADELDAELARHGMVPAASTETVETTTESGVRVTVNGLYRKRGNAG
jgi:SAM-dependent methyltransferase